MKTVRILRGFGLAFLYFLAIAARADSGLFAEWHTDTYSEPEPVATTIKDWGDEFDSGEHQWLLSEFTLGYRFQNGLELSWQRRAQASSRINSEAASVYGRIQREEPLPEGEVVPLELRVDAFAANSVRVGYHHQWDSGHLLVGLSYLQATHLIDGTLRGEFVTLADSEYQMSAEVDYVYYTDPIFNRPDIQRAEGQGISADLALVWQLSSHWSLAMEGKDLWASIDWKRAPHSVGQANTRRKQIDEDGYARFDPLFTGRERYKDKHNQRVAPRLHAQLDRTWKSWSLSGQWRRQFDVNHWGAGIGFQPSESQRLSLTAWPQREALELTWQAHRWYVALHTDLQGWSKTQSLGLTLSYNIP